jgi:hypothetical protein
LVYPVTDIRTFRIGSGLEGMEIRLHHDRTTARILHDEKKKIIIRATITTESCSQIPEIISTFVIRCMQMKFIWNGFDGWIRKELMAFHFEMQIFCSQFVKGNERQQKKEQP